jgi:phosphoribosylformimino-5-aminoimidazole carboxamide ribotide isomerase
VIVIPAIDLHDGQCVRLLQGDFNRVTVYADDPVQMAQEWQKQGAERLHIVDLDGSLAGKPRNGDIIRTIAKTLSIPVELGGGIREMAVIDEYLAAGVEWVILGTAAIRNRQLLHDAAQKYPGRIILGLDAKEGMISVQGWTETTSLSVKDVVDGLSALDLAAVIYTDIARDGMQTGVNVEATRRLAQMTRIPVIASGGVSNIQDIRLVSEIESDGVIGVIAGKALYAGTLSLPEAIAAARGNNS